MDKRISCLVRMRKSKDTHLLRNKSRLRKYKVVPDEASANESVGRETSPLLVRRHPGLRKLCKFRAGQSALESTLADRPVSIAAAVETAAAAAAAVTNRQGALPHLRRSSPVTTPSLPSESKVASCAPQTDSTHTAATKTARRRKSLRHTVPANPASATLPSSCVPSVPNHPHLSKDSVQQYALGNGDNRQAKQHEQNRSSRPVLAVAPVSDLLNEYDFVSDFVPVADGEYDLISMP